MCVGGREKEMEREEEVKKRLHHGRLSTVLSADQAFQPLFSLSLDPLLSLLRRWSSDSDADGREVGSKRRDGHLISERRCACTHIHQT